MARPLAPSVLHGLLRRIADRDPAALAQLHTLMADKVLDHVTAETGDSSAAPAITRAVFLEVWRLAPVLVRRHLDPPAVAAPHRDADTWLAAIAARRSADHLRTPTAAQPIMAAYHHHTAAELAAVLAAGTPAQ